MKRTTVIVPGDGSPWLEILNLPTESIDGKYYEDWPKLEEGLNEGKTVCSFNKKGERLFLEGYSTDESLSIVLDGLLKREIRDVHLQDKKKKYIINIDVSSNK